MLKRVELEKIHCMARITMASGCKRAERFGSAGDNSSAEMDQNFRDIDLDRAYFIASAAEAGCVGKRLAALHHGELRRQDGADWAGIDRSIGVAARLPIDGACILTGAATNAVQRLARFGIAQDFCSAVVEQHDVKLFRTVAGVNACPHGVVWIHPLAGGGSWAAAAA